MPVLSSFFSVTNHDLLKGETHVNHESASRAEQPIAGNGGAIDNDQYGNDSPGMLIISNSRFTENEARWSSFASGGAISNNGPATITDCRFEDNFSNRMAGAVVHSGYTHTMTVGNCTFANNSSRRWGGTIFNLGYGTTLHVLDSTFFGNTTGSEGGAIENYYGTLDITNSTISGNSSSGQAGGIWNLGELKITNSTVFNNLAETGGGGLYQVSHSWFLNPELKNTIVAGNLTGEPDSHVLDDIYGMLGASSSHNLIGDAATASGLTDGDDGNIVGNAGIGTIDITTVLAPNLADNGGPTLTHALVPGGPAVDAGDNHKAVDGEGNLLVYDQRGEGFARIVGGTVDIGAFEVQPRSVQIDVKPGSDPNSINLANQGVIAVAILTTEAFDALLVDASTVVFAGASAVHWAWEDVDGDGDLDLMLHFRTQDTQLADLYAQLLAEDLNEDGVLDSNRQTATVSLTGQTTADEYFAGYDDVELFLAGKNLRDLLKVLAAAGAI